MTEFPKSFTRRRFISSATIGAIGIQTLTPISAFAATTYDVIIIGAGTAGIPCAIHAAAAGAKVLLIDKSVQIGGSLWLAGGSMAAAGTRIQARKGIVDTPDMHYNDVMHLGHYKAVPEIVRRYVENAGPMADWLEDLGFQVRDGEPVAGRGGHAAFSVARYFQGPEKGRSILKVLLPALKQQVDAGHVRILMSTGVDELVMDRHQNVKGVIASSDNGARTQFLARKVVITSGGYCNSPEMFKKVTGYECYARTAYYMAKGEGLLLGESAGGFIRGGEKQILGPGGIVNDRNLPSVFAWQPELDYKRRPQWEIRVNQQGQRFVREDHPDQDERDILFTRQPTQRMWLIFDQQIEEQAPAILRGKSKEDVEALFGSHPMFFREPTIEALALRGQLNAENLKRTVEEYNFGVRNKKDALGREFLPCEIAKAPFYAIEVTGGNLVGFGGLAVNPDMQLLRPDGSAIKNLYAAGEVIGLSTIAGDTVVSGTGVTPSLTFGRLIGMSVMRKV
jgi:fumarate reductase flavoprotein subunit